uniref:Uncharacterized protein n=1 Tax=Ditylenchus dipsaci TaxID=166011 RepID=A0A915D6F6_9BILA
MRTVWLRCVVLVQPTTQKQHKYLLAVSDTYASKCNETLFFTDSSVLLEKLSDSLNIFLLEGLNPAKWSFFLRVLRFLEARPPTISTNTTTQWTAFVNEQTYLVVDNLLLLIAQAGAPAILGRLENIRSPVSFLFPFTQTTAFCMDSGIALSDKAIHLIAGNNNQECLSSNWLIPKYTGKALLKCGRQIGAYILDPIDQDGHHLFVGTSLRSLFTKPQQALSFLLPRQSITQQQSVVSDCCSHKAIGFGQLSYRDIRLMHYFVNQMRVFGV